MGKKIYARQVPPEHQESPLYCFCYTRDGLDLSELYTGITLTGNRDFCGYKTPEYEAAEHVDDAADEWINGQEWTGEPVKIEEALRDYGIEKQNGKKWTPRELGQWKRLFQSWDRNPYDGRDADDRIADALELMTGKPYTAQTLRGCSQGDYIKCFFPYKEYTQGEIDRLETEYFNTGEEWIIYDEDPDNNPEADCFSCYVYSWKDDEKRAEIAAAAGGAPDDMELHEFTGWRRIACYA